MQEPKRPISSSSVPDDILPEDEIDQLFGNLQLIEPPPALIARILATVSQISQAEAQKKGLLADEQFDDLDNLIVRNEKKEPS